MGDRGVKPMKSLSYFFIFYVALSGNVHFNFANKKLSALKGTSRLFFFSFPSYLVSWVIFKRHTQMCIKSSVVFLQLAEGFHTLASAPPFSVLTSSAASCLFWALAAGPVTRGGTCAVCPRFLFEASWDVAREYLRRPWVASEMYYCLDKKEESIGCAHG